MKRSEEENHVYRLKHLVFYMDDMISEQQTKFDSKSISGWKL
jgi:hypothetical protein